MEVTHNLDSNSLYQADLVNPLHFLCTTTQNVTDNSVCYSPNPDNTVRTYRMVAHTGFSSGDNLRPKAFAIMNHNQNGNYLD